MASSPTDSKKKRRARTVGQTWLIRVGVALLVGLGMGAAAGVFTVNTLEPGRANSVDSLQVMLDSIAGGRLPGQASTDPIDSAIASAEASRQAEQDSALIAVPSLLDLEEGDARNSIADAGLQVGEVQFQSSPKPAGLVLATFPVAGARVTAGSAVTLILSDGRPAGDTLAGATDIVHPSFPTSRR